MARPLKFGFDYFSLDCHFDDEVELLEAEYGLEGFAILIKLWQKIYSNGYYIVWNNDIELLFSKKTNTNKDKVNSVINSCLFRNLFNKNMYQKYGILTSSGVQKRYITSCVASKRKSISIEKRFLLVNGDLKALITELTQVNPEETLVNPCESTQEIRLEEIRLEENRLEENKIYCEVVSYLNEATNSKFKNTDTTKTFVNARIKEGASLDDFKKVINKKTADWINTDMQKFLRPQTLFGTKFDGYLNEKVTEKKSQNYFLDLLKNKKGELTDGQK